MKEKKNCPRSKILSKGKGKGLGTGKGKGPVGKPNKRSILTNILSKFKK